MNYSHNPASRYSLCCHSIFMVTAASRQATLLVLIRSLWKTISRQNYGMKIQLSSWRVVTWSCCLTAGDIKSMFRKVPLIHRHGIFQVFLLPGPTSAYMIQKHGLISRPKLVEDTTKLSDHSDNLIQSGSIPDLSISNSEETKFIKRLLLTLGAAMKPMTENNPGLQLRIIVGHLDLLGAAPGPQYAWSELNGLLGKLSTRGVASFAARYATRII